MRVNESTWERIERSRERWNVLRHPFYQRWSQGELSSGELARYSGQYRHAVEAIATISSTVADVLPERSELREHAEEERAHVRLWDGFVAATGGETAAEPTSETAECVRAWTGAADPAEMLARLYAIESSQPPISRTKLDGLLGHYGYERGSATAYFEVHERRDVEHAAEVRELIEALGEQADADAVVAAAESAYRANWRLLDGV
jgi:pyrroloquinoline-quinone synthase